MNTPSGSPEKTLSPASGSPPSGSPPSGPPPSTATTTTTTAAPQAKTQPQKAAAVNSPSPDLFFARYSFPSGLTVVAYLPRTTSSREWQSALWLLDPLTGKYENKTHLCVLCLESNAEERKFLVASSGNVTNLKKHMEKKHLSVPFSGVRITKLPSLINGDHVVVFGGGSVVFDRLGQLSLKQTSREQMCDAVEDLSVDINLLALCENKKFRYALVCAHNAPSEEMFNMSRTTIRQRVWSKADDILAEIKRKIVALPKGQKVFVGFDEWSKSANKMLGIIVSFIWEDENGTLTLEHGPIGLCQLAVDLKTDTIQSTSQLAHILLEELKTVGVTLENLGGLKGDNAVNAVQRLVMQSHAAHLGIALPDGMKFDDFSSWIGCISHILSLCMQDANGTCSRGGTSDKPEMCNAACRAIVEDYNNICALCHTSKIKSRCAAKAEELETRFYLFSYKSDTRWNGTVTMFECGIKNHEILVQVLNPIAKATLDGRAKMESRRKSAASAKKSTAAPKKSSPKPPVFALNSEQFQLAQDMHAIMRPILTFTLGATQRSNKPSAHVILVLITTLLIEYGVDLRGGLFVAKLESLPRDLLMTVPFEVLLPGGKETKRRELGEMSSDAQHYFFTVQANLIFRFHKQRGNYFFYEVLSLMLDPVMMFFATFVLGDKYEPTKTWVSELLALDVSSKGVAEKRARVAPTTSPLDYGVLPPFLMDSELDRFIKHHKHFETFENLYGAGTPLRLQPLLKLIKSYDNLEYWSTKDSQRDFPTIRRRCLSSLGYQASNALVESIFSIMSSVLTGENSNFSETTIKALAVRKGWMFVNERNEKARAREKTPDKDMCKDLNEDVSENLDEDMCEALDEDVVVVNDGELLAKDTIWLGQLFELEERAAEMEEK